MSSRDALRARLSDITAEMEKLGRHERPTRTQELRFNDLQTEFADTSKLIADADRQAPVSYTHLTLPTTPYV